jgi:uncharacterized membrane protein YdfJ with MMPL/SSD domain
MRSLRFVCWFAILVIVMVAARSNRVAYAIQPGALPPDAQKLTAASAQAPAAQKPQIKFAKPVVYNAEGYVAESVAGRMAVSAK